MPKLVPDNLKTGISHAGFYDPAINRSYLDLARHYGIGVVPARVRKPRDKPLAENAVQQVERWVAGQAEAKRRPRRSAGRNRRVGAAVGLWTNCLNRAPKAGAVDHRQLSVRADRPA